MDNRDDPAIHNMSIFAQKRGYGELSSVDVACSVGTEPAAKKSTNYEDEVATILTNASSYQKAAIYTEYMECEHGDGLSSIGDYTHSNNRRNNSGSSSFCSKGSSKKSKKIAARSSSHLSMSKTNTDTKMDSTRSQDNSGGFYSSGKDANDDTSVSTSSLGYRWITL